jgi:drug/metabolite transporter (DMT)-like permease
MEPVAIALVLTAAVMHATWNAVVKVDGDRLMTMAVVISTTGLLAPLLLLHGPPPAPESWPYIVLSALLNNAYFLFLIEAYRFGDLSHVYPIARGSAPLLVAAGAWGFAGEHLSITEFTGVIVISVGIISLVWGSGLKFGTETPAMVFALLTGLMIAVYTVVDGIGVRLSGNPAGFIGWLFILNPIPILAIALVRRRSQAWVYLRTNWRPAVLGGFLNLGSYGLSIWALTLGNMAHVSALRETSVIIAAVIGTRVLGEAFGSRRVLAAAAVAFGVVLIALQA